MNIHKRYIFQKKHIQLGYTVFGSGREIMLAFHGFGLNADAMKPLGEAWQEQYTLISFDLFFHGASLWPASAKSVAANPVSKSAWKEIMETFLKEKGIGQFSLCGFSFGSKFALATAEIFPGQVNEIHLLAPEGIKPNKFYRAATRIRPIRNFYKSLIVYPGPYFSLISFFHNAGLAHKRLLRFAQNQMQTRKQRHQVYLSWVAFRTLTFQPEKLVRLFNRNKIKVSIYVGKFDKVVPPERVEGFAARLKWGHLVKCKSGHTHLIDEVARYLTNPTNHV